MIRSLANIYRRLPIKPFRGILGRLYRNFKFHIRHKSVITTRNGITYELDLNELIDSSIYFDGCFEPKTTAVIDKYVQQGMTILDIGANIGCHTLRLSRLVGNGGKVIAFEPMSFAFNKLQRNLELNNFSNVVAEKIALSDEDSGNQIVSFYSSWPLDSNSPNILHPIHGGRSTRDTVYFMTLDSYIRRNQLDKIDFIKLDVDGFEYKVIWGGVNTLKRFRPIMIVEFSRYTLKDFDDSLEELVDLLVLLGYSFYSQDDFRQYERREDLLRAIPADAAINVLCLPKISQE